MSTRSLLTAGAVAGPWFVLVVVVQLFTRDGFDLTHHPVSLLSTGSAGWVQIANFVTTGLMCLAMAAGLRRTMRSGRGHAWVPRLVGVCGVGFVAGGVFVADPGLGFPPGTPDAVPADLSWHGSLHAVAPPFAFTALVAAAVVMSRRHAAAGERVPAGYALASGIVTFVLAALPHEDSVSWRLALAIVVGLTWLTSLALQERAALSPHSDPVARPAVRPRRG